LGDFLLNTKWKECWNLPSPYRRSCFIF
jgi:hypothetical protein